MFGFSPRPISKQRSSVYETTCRKTKIMTNVSVASTLLQGILPLFWGQLLLDRVGSTSGIHLWHFLGVWCTLQHRGVFSTVCHTGSPDHNMSHQWCSVNPFMLLCPWSTDRMQQCPGNPPGEPCARTDCWDSGGFLPDTTEPAVLTAQLFMFCYT